MIKQKGLRKYKLKVVNILCKGSSLICYNDFEDLGGETACREAGRLRQEGKEYIVKDGDVMHFLFNN